MIILNDQLGRRYRGLFKVRFLHLSGSNDDKNEKSVWRQSGAGRRIEPGSFRCETGVIVTVRQERRRRTLLSEFLVTILIRPNKVQQYAGIYLLQNHSTCFGCPSHPSSGVHKNVTAASGTGHSIRAATFLQRGNATLEEGCCSDTMTCTRGCSYSFMNSWWWVRWTPETCRVILQ